MNGTNSPYTVYVGTYSFMKRLTFRERSILSNNHRQKRKGSKNEFRPGVIHELTQECSLSWDGRGDGSHEYRVPRLNPTPTRSCQLETSRQKREKDLDSNGPIYRTRFRKLKNLESQEQKVRPSSQRTRRRGTPKITPSLVCDS